MRMKEWIIKKPMFNKECLVICAHKFRNEWEYNLYQIKKVEYDEIWYWGWLNSDGEECGPLEDMKATKYFVMPLLKNTI